MLEKTKQNVMKLETERLKICDRDQNIVGLEKICADEKTMELYPDFRLNPERPLAVFLPLLEQHGIFVFPFKEKLEDAVIGFITINNVDEATKSIEIGYFLLSSHWSKGYASEITVALIEILKNQDWQRIMATVYSGNAASERLLERCGFALEDVIKDKCVINGNNHDDMIYSYKF
ncbi:MAG: GNAT family N-acetyltransferase [Defluviitaleaceae bacterium]|nr:GNAT family N-acetyltransferase [Defluviitaleaceae bacterium]